MNAPVSTTDGPASGNVAVALRRAGNVVGTLVLVGIVTISLVYSVPQVVGAEQSYVVLSGSMEPALSPGDVILVYPVDPRDVSAGDVITYQTDGTNVPTTHRVVEVVPTNDFDSGIAFRTKGDANPERDLGLRPGEKVVGHVPTVSIPFLGDVVLHLPYMGHVIQFANTAYGFLLFIALPVVLFVLNEALRLGSKGGSQTESDPSDDAPESEPETESHAEAPDRVIIGTGDDGFTLRRRDLTVAVGVLSVTTVYTAWLATTRLSAWTVGVAVASFGSLVFAANLRRLATRSPPAPEPSPARGVASPPALQNRVVQATLPPVLESRPQIRLASRADLLAYADVINRLVVEDTTTGEYYLPDGDLLYTVEGPDTLAADGDGRTDGTPADGGETNDTD